MADWKETDIIEIDEPRPGAGQMIYLPEILAGLKITLKHLFGWRKGRNHFTMQYPEERREAPETWKHAARVGKAGLPLEPEPYAAVAESVGCDTPIVLSRLHRMLNIGSVRRIGAVPNHYALGYRGNGMTVWDVPDERVDELGEQVGALDFVSHCYRRPRHLPDLDRVCQAGAKVVALVFDKDLRLVF